MISEDHLETPTSYAGCRGCAGADDTWLDVRPIPREDRCAEVHAALLGLGPGEELVVVAPHNPLPQLHLTLGPALARFRFHYLAACPCCWRLALVRPDRRRVGPESQDPAPAPRTQQDLRHSSAPGGRHTMEV